MEQYNGTTYAGDDITAYDGMSTIWSSVLSENSHAFYANGENLNLGGMPSYQLNAQASIILGAYSASGYDFVGEIEQFLVFESALSTSDRELIEAYLSSEPGLAAAVPGLSAEALESLVAHYDGSQGVETDDSAVLSWTPVDAQGELLSEMKLESMQRGGGASDLISYHPEGRLLFDDTAEGDDGRYLEGTLSNDGSTSFTVIWRGQYSADAPFATSGTNAYNIGPNATSHQRDDGKGGFVVEQYNGTTYAGDDITAFDGVPTVWSSVLAENSHAFYANGQDLNLGGMPSYQLNAGASIILGAYSASGYDFVGEIEELLIFESALSASDRERIETYLGSTPPDEEEPVVDAPGIVIFREGNEVTIQISEQAHLLASEDLVNWSIIPEAAPELTLPADQGQQFFRAVDSISEISEGMVFRTRVSSDTWREAEYHLDTGAFYFIGEKSHGFDHYTSGGNDLWWCYMNTGGKGSGLIEFLMERNQDAEATKNRALDSGWLAYTGNAYGFLELEALPAQQTLVNHTAPETSGQNDTTEAYSEDYDVIDHKNVYYVLYKNGGNGHLYLGIGGPSLTEQAGALPPGDGSPNRDNGVRGDVAFKTVIPLSDADKQALIETFTPMTPAYNDTSGAYHYMHPEGL